MAKFQRPGMRRRSHPRNYLYKNERIRAREVRCIGPDGKQIGIMPTADAIKRAKMMGLDLVEISNKVKPSVCQICDSGKYKYEQSKKHKDQKQATHKMKELKFRLTTEHHDYSIKLRHAEEFLYRGDRVKITIMFRGREREHKDIGLRHMKQVIVDLEHVGAPEIDPKFLGRNLTLMLVPLPKYKRKLKYNEIAEEEEKATAGNA